jgi:hypothetical protein
MSRSRSVTERDLGLSEFASALSPAVAGDMSEKFNFAYTSEAESEARRSGLVK